MKEVIIVGAGHGGIVAASKLAEQGYKVTIFEKNKFEDLGYDFTDVFEIECFKDLNIDIDYEKLPKKDNMTFISPDLKNSLTPIIPDEYQEHRMERKEIYKCLIKLLENKNVYIIDNTKVKDFIIENDKVIGVKTIGDKNYHADLVIDSAGYNFSPRKKLPLFIDQFENNQGDFLYAYRATYKKTTENIDKYKVYLYALGIRGIAWVVCLDDEIDVLVGSVDVLTNELIDKALEFLKIDNACLNDNKIRGGRVHKIPINRPISRFFTNGYVIIGDGACMTIPLIGSGIANSIFAGQLLAEAINEHGLNNEAYWSYQYNYMKKRGKVDASLNCIKRLLLNLDEKSVDFMFDKKVIIPNDLLTCCAGRELKLKLPDLIGRGIRGRRKIKLLMKFGVAYLKSRKIFKVIKKMPKIYNEINITKFIKKYEKF